MTRRFKKITRAERELVEPIKVGAEETRSADQSGIKTLVGKSKKLQRPEAEHADVFIVSYPKCGRTWLRLMLGKALTLHFGVENVNLLELEQLTAVCPGIPLIELTHDDESHLKTPDEISLTKTRYAGKKVVLLARDIRDIVVSYYFEYTRRCKLFPEYGNYDGDITSFLHYERGSVDTIIAFYNSWAENRHIPSDFLLIRYKDMRVNTEKELRRVLDFIGLGETSGEVVCKAVEYSCFENMRKMELNDTFESRRLRPADKNDIESYKTRRGKVGGFVDYLSKADIAYLNQKLDQVSDFYGYDYQSSPSRVSCTT